MKSARNIVFPNQAVHNKGREAEVKMEKQQYLSDEPFTVLWEEAENGIYPEFAGTDLKSYKSLHTFLHQSFGGRIPVMHMKDREEFERLIREIFYQGEQRQIPASMGALAIKGWKDASGTAHRAILLSDGYYSAVPPEAMGLSPEEWKEKSFTLRLAHECTHYYTLRAFGFMNSGLKDELIADTMGIIEAFGEYRAEWFLRFMGLENYPNYREGGRLQNYLPKDQEISDVDFRELQAVTYEAAMSLEAHIKAHPEYLTGTEGKLLLLNRLAENEAIGFLEKQPPQQVM